MTLYDKNAEWSGLGSVVDNKNPEVDRKTLQTTDHAVHSSKLALVCIKNSSAFHFAVDLRKTNNVRTQHQADRLQETSISAVLETMSEVIKDLWHQQQFRTEYASLTVSFRDFVRRIVEKQKLLWSRTCRLRDLASVITA